MTSHKKTPMVKPDGAEQSKRFEATARELGVDETGKAFKRAVDAVVPRRHQCDQKTPP